MAQVTPRERKREKPVGIILSADKVLLRTALQSTPMQALPGMLLFAGDSLENSDSGSIEFVLCADRKQRGLPAGGKAGIETASANGSLEKNDTVAFCSLPDVDREAPAQNADDEDLPVPPAGETLDDRIQGLPDSERGEFISAYNEIVKALQQRSDDLPARIARAVILEQHKLDLDASDEYRSISDQWPGAVWARGKARETLPPKNDSATAGPGKTWALVVGVSHYDFAGQGLSNLLYAHVDAATFADFLEAPRGGQLNGKGPDPELTVLTEQEATLDAIGRALDDVLTKAKGNDTVILYFATHGAVAAVKTDPKNGGQKSYDGFILTPHSDPGELATSALSMDELRSKVLKNLGHIKRLLLYVDVCHAAQLGVITDAVRINEMIAAVFNTGRNKLGILMASRPDELAFEAKEYGDGHGAFTYFLLRGLNGDADGAPYGDGDGVVTATELLNYVKTNVETATRENQHPADVDFLLDSKQPMSYKNVSPGIDLKPWSVPPKALFRGSKYTLLSDVAPRGSPGPPAPEPTPSEDFARRFDAAMEAGRLRPDQPQNAFAALQDLKGHATPVNQELARVLESRLLTALENRGQSVILQYLQGDQEPLKKEQFVEAALDFETALQLSPAAQFDESRGKFCRGRALIYEKNYSDAVRLLEQAIRLDPARAYAYNALGIAYLEQVNTDVHYFEYASDAFQDAIDRAPYWPYPRHNLALALTQRGDYQRAAAEYRAAMDVGPHYSYLPFNLGLLYQQIADFPQAKTYYQDASRIAEQRCALRLGKEFKACPERSLPRTGLAALEIQQGNRRKARRLLDDALRDDGTNLDAAHDEAALLADWRGHENQAEEIWKRNLQADPKHLPTLIGYSELLSRSCRFQEALPLYRDTLKQIKDYVPAQIGLARSLVAAGELDEAGRLTASLVQQRPANADAWAARAEFLSRKGEDASDAWDRAMHFAKDGSQRKQLAERRKGGCALKKQAKH